jgi:hypothetical protein
MVKQDTTPDAPSHSAGTSKGEEQIKNQGKEPGRIDTGTDDEGRPTATTTARNSSSVNADEREPIDPEMPDMPPA